MGLMPPGSVVHCLLYRPVAREDGQRLGRARPFQAPEAFLCGVIALVCCWI